MSNESWKGKQGDWLENNVVWRLGIENKMKLWEDKWVEEHLTLYRCRNNKGKTKLNKNIKKKSEMCD